MAKTLAPDPVPEAVQKLANIEWARDRHEFECVDCGHISSAVSFEAASAARVDHRAVCDYRRTTGERA
jgi:hypothetical protein